MKAVAPFKEAIEMIRDAGGEAFRKCFQCGLCTASCPWNNVRIFMPHKKITESRFGLVGAWGGGLVALFDVQHVCEPLSSGSGHHRCYTRCPQYHPR